MIFEMKRQLSLGGQLWFKIFSYRQTGRASIDPSKSRANWIKSRAVLLTVALLVAVTTLVKWTNTVSADVGLLTKWGAQGTTNGLFNGPFGVAVDSSGNVYVSDSGNRIQKFNSTGAFITQWGTTGSASGFQYSVESP
jgi:DNA-binding beta-propeller fold protein YncE